MYAWASNNNSQVGNSTNFLSTTPKLVLSNVVCISCGDNFTMAVTRNGKVYGWGSNDFGQLGIDNYGSKNATSPNLSMTNNICGSILIIQMGPAGGSFENKNITPQLIGMPEDLVVGNFRFNKAVNEEAKQDH